MNGVSQETGLLKVTALKSFVARCRLNPPSTNNKAITHHDCPLQFPIPSPRYRPDHLYKCLRPFDNAGHYGPQPERLFRDILEMRPGWGTAKPVRQFVLFGDGDLSFLWTVKKGRVKPLPLARILSYRKGMHGVGSFVCS
ncbi:transmembrane protein [Histoplasma ohiense]|nr:transmembrane protein [Histoplasma ohiense (nom. inval.)]